MAALKSAPVYCLKMLRNLCVGIKTVDHIKILRHFRCLLWKIRSAASADDHYINLIFHCENVIN